MSRAQTASEPVKAARALRARGPARAMLFSELYRIQLGMHVEGRERDADIIQQSMDEIKKLRIATGYYGPLGQGPTSSERSGS